MFIAAIIVAIIGVTLVGLIVFGGGQIFMPLFETLWKSLNEWFNLGIENIDDKIQGIFTISNATPGVVSTKFAAFTGILISNGAWWGWIISIVTYLCFCLPAIFLMILASKMLKKSEESKYLNKLMVIFKPIVAGILISLAIQLLISTWMPQVVFNKGIENFSQNGQSDFIPKLDTTKFGSEYLGIINNSKTEFFMNNWRMYVLFIWVPLAIVVSCILYTKKVPLFYLFIGGMVLSLILFQPWL